MTVQHLQSQLLKTEARGPESEGPNQPPIELMKFYLNKNRPGVGCMHGFYPNQVDLLSSKLGLNIKTLVFEKQKQGLEKLLSG